MMFLSIPIPKRSPRKLYPRSSMRRSSSSSRRSSPRTWSGTGVFLLGVFVALCSGCAAIPEVSEQPRYHNPFPQMHRVAILPFFNLSSEPTVNGEEVALAYYNELQLIPGFEVMPVGVVKQQLMAQRLVINEGTNFQQLAKDLGVEAVIVGAITDFQAYYPPRMGIRVNWYAANPGFHPIPAGYGLPWGTSEEEFIPEELVFDAEFALARPQLETQTPENILDKPRRSMDSPDGLAGGIPRGMPPEMGTELGGDGLSATAGEASEGKKSPDGKISPDGLPEDWPDPRGFVPSPPEAQRPMSFPQYAPIITHTRTYNGHDESFTNRLSEYYYFRDDARFGGWQAYLQRSEDFIRFCCYLHLTETLAARGGASESRVVWRWPLSRYEP